MKRTACRLMMSVGLLTLVLSGCSSPPATSEPPTATPMPLGRVDAGEADNGQTAVLIAGSLEPDVVLMDLVMPGMDGSVAPGKSNGEIADELVVSEETVRTHVSNILSKLHLASRTQATLFALREELTSLDDAGARLDARHSDPRAGLWKPYLQHSS